LVTTSTTRKPDVLAAAALLAASAGCVFDEGSSLHRDSSVEISMVEGSPACAAAGFPGAVEVTIAPATSGTVTHESGLAITLETGGGTFHFSASPGVDAVIASGPRESTIYQYVPPALGDASLTAPAGASDAADAPERVTFCRMTLGCTLTAGYWRTHSERGPARFDETWAQLPRGGDTEFFLSGRTYHDLLWTEPAGGHAYVALAHAYIAAELSQLAGADAEVIAEPFADATEVLEAYTPEEIAELPASSSLRHVILELASVLDEYVSGRLGPGHCEGAGREGDPVHR
jgi:hypothetical protein